MTEKVHFDGTDYISLCGADYDEEELPTKTEVLEEVTCRECSKEILTIAIRLCSRSTVLSLVNVKIR